MSEAARGFDVTKGMVPLILVVSIFVGGGTSLAGAIWWASAITAKVDMLSKRLEPVPAMLESSRSNAQDIKVIQEKMVEMREEQARLWEFWRVDTRNMQKHIDRLDLEIQRLEEKR